MNTKDYHFNAINNAILNLFEYSFCRTSNELVVYDIKSNLESFFNDVRSDIAMQTDENIHVLELYVKAVLYFIKVPASVLANLSFGSEEHMLEQFKAIPRRENDADADTMINNIQHIVNEIGYYLTERESNMATCGDLDITPQGLSQTFEIDVKIGKYAGFYAVMRELHTITNKIYPNPKELKTDEVEVNTGVIEWLGTPSELAYLMLELAEKGYINAPVKADKTINSQGYHRQIEKSFTLNSGKISSVLTELKAGSLSPSNVVFEWVKKMPKNVKP